MRFAPPCPIGQVWSSRLLASTLKIMPTERGPQILGVPGDCDGGAQEEIVPAGVRQGASTAPLSDNMCSRWPGRGRSKRRAVVLGPAACRGSYGSAPAGTFGVPPAARRRVPPRAMRRLLAAFFPWRSSFVALRDGLRSRAVRIRLSVLHANLYRRRPPRRLSGLSPRRDPVGIDPSRTGVTCSSPTHRSITSPVRPSSCWED